MRKFFTLLAILCLLVTVSACGGADEPAPTEAPAATEAPEPTEKPEPKPTDEPEPEPTDEPEPEPTDEPEPEPEPAAGEGSIAVLLPDSASSARWENDDRRFFEQAFDAAGVEYTIVNAEGDARTQQTQAEQAITNGAKVLLLVNLDSGSGAAIIAQAREAGVAVIDYDRLTIEGDGADYYVSFDNEAVGRLQGEGLVKAVEEAGLENPKVAVLNGSPTDNNATLFKNGYDSVINPLFDSGEWTEVDDQSVPDWDNQQALVIFEQMLTAAGGEIDAAIAANDGLGGSVYAALANQGLDPIPVTGQDATVGGIQNILAGRQSMTVYKAIKAEAEAAAELAVAILNGDDPSSMASSSVDNGTNEVPSVLLVPVSVTKDNIEETVIADGFRTWEEICVGDFAQYCPGEGGGTDSGDAGPVDGSIAVLLPDSASSARWENDDRRFLEQAFEEAGVEYTILNAEGDARTQQTQAEQAITNGAKVLLLVNLDSGSGAAIIAQAREADVAVIDYDRLTIQGDGADYYVSFDNESVGRLQGEGLVKAVEEAGISNPRVAVLNGSPTDNNATLFKNGYDSVINPLFDSGEWTEVDDQSVPDWDNQQALIIFEQMLTAAGGEIDAAIAANDGIGGSVYAALANQGLDPIPVTGQDATVGGIQNILAGRQSMTVYKAIKAEAEAAAELAIAILQGSDTSDMVTSSVDNGTNDVPSVLLTPVSVTKDNIEETVIADGFRTWEEICVGDFAQYCPGEGGGTDSGDAGPVDGSIAVLLPDSASSARWENDDRRFLEQAFEEAGVEYTIVNAEGDARTQQTQAEQAITNGAKVLLLVNLDSGSGAAIIAQAREADVAVIDYDRLTIQGDGADYYVSFDNESVGRLQGEGLVKAVEEAGIENPRVAVLNGSPTDNNATLFKNGYDSVINPLFESGEWTEVDDQSVPDWDNQQALIIFEQMLTASGGEIDAAIAANDGLGGSVYAALANQGLDPIPVTGQDATVGGIQNILAGRQSMTVYKAIKAEAEAAAELAIGILQGSNTSDLVTGSVDNGTNDVPSVLLTPVSVTKDNIEETVIADGFRTWEEICVGDFAQYCPGEDGGTDSGTDSGAGPVDGSIAVLLPDSASSARWENDDRRFLEQAFEEAGVEYTIVNAEGDARTQQTQAEQAITNGAKVLLLVNLDSGSGAAIIAQAREADVAVIDYDRLTIQGDGADYYVSFDNESVGRLQGEGLVKAVEEAGISNPRVAVLNGSPTDNNATLFKNGYDSVINPLFDSGEWTEVDDQSVPDWDNQQALIIFEQMLTASGGEIDAAIAANDGLGGSVYAALANQGLDPIPVTGQDATVGGIQNILAGRQSMTVYKAIKAEAEAAAELAIGILQGSNTSDLVTGSVDNGTNDVPSVLLTPVSVTKDNIEETVIADGFRTWEEICVGDFAQYCPGEDGGTDSSTDSGAGPVDGSIAVLLPDSASSARWENDDRRFLEQAFEEAGVEYTIVNAEGDARTQQTQAEQAITNGAKVLLLVNLDSGSGAAIIAQAREADVAVIDYDRLTIQGDGADYYVSFDNESVGRLQGEGLVKAVEEAGISNPRVAVLNGSPTDNNATLFKNGYDSVINPLFDSGAWTEVDDQSVPDWDNQQALIIFEQMLTASGGEIDAAIAANDGLGGSVYAALANQGLDPIPVTGQDATVGGIQNILAGRQSMTVYKAIKAEAEAAAALAIAILTGDDTSDLVTGSIDNGTNDVPSVLLTPVSVTKDNIAETVIADGFRSWGEICVGDFAKYCPGSGESTIDGSIAVLLPDSASSARWENDDRRFLKQAFEDAGIEYTIVNAEGDARTQQTQAEQAITNGAKVLLLVNLDSGSGAAIIAQAREADVAVIDYDRLTVQGDGADYYVSFDNESVGRLQGEGLVKAVEEAGIENARVAILNGSPTDNNATLFKNGYDSVINPLFDSGEWTEVDDQSVPDWDNQQALIIFEQMLTASGGEIDAAIAANDGLGGSVYAALANQGLDPIPVTGQDATVGGVQNILAGRQSMTVYKAIKAEAEAAAALGIAILKGDDTSDLVTGSINNGTNDVPSVLLTPVSVTQDNIAETVIADGFRTWDEICIGEFEEFCPADR